MTAGRNDAARLRGPWLALGRVAVVAFGLGFVVLFVVAAPFRYQLLTTPCAPVASCQTFQLGPLDVATMPVWLSLESYAAYQIALEAAYSLIGLVVGALIFYRASHTRIGLLTTVVMIFIGFSTEVILALADAVPWVRATYTPVLVAGFALMWLFVMVFPDGRIAPPRIRRWFPLILLLLVGFYLWGLFVDAVGALQYEPLFSAIWFSTFVFAFGVQVVRYRHHATPEQRQQVKWVVVGLGALVLTLFLWVAVIEPTTAVFLRGVPRLAPSLLGAALTLILVSALPVTLVYAILRRRLWDVDRIINRALVYGSLTLTLTGIYLGTVVLLQRVVLAGQDSSLVVAASTLLIAALFAPLRRRIQALIDRRFFRSKYDGQKALAAFAATARSQVDLDALTGELLRVVGSTVQPRQLGLWLKPDAGSARRSEAFSRKVS